MSLLRVLVATLRHPFKPDDAEATTRYAETVTDQAETSSVRARISLKGNGDWFEGTWYPDPPAPRRFIDE